MSVCTLPAPVSPQLLGWCPQVKIVLFISETHLILCRQSGQQVWNTRLLPPSPGAKPSSVSWSPDGQHFALVFTDGVYTVHQVSNGRQPSAFRPDQTKVASVAWATTSYESSKSLANHQSSVQSSSCESRASVAAMGTVNGRLKVSVYGALSISEIELSPGSSSAVYRVFVDDNSKEYAAVQDTCFYVYKMSSSPSSQPVAGPERLSQVMEWLNYADSNTILSIQSQKTARQSARAVELVTTLMQSCSKLTTSLRDAHKQISVFLQAFTEKSQSPKDVLLAAALYGTLDAVGIDWIQSQHEQGFKRWYKALSQSFDTLRKLLMDDILIPMEELLTVVDDLRGLRDSDFVHISQAHELVFKMIDDTVRGGHRFELQACFIEHLFREETDRPIAVTKITKVALGEVVDSLVGPGMLLGLPAIEMSEQLGNMLAQIQSSINNAVQETRDTLRAQMRLCYSVDVGQVVREVKRLSNGDGYKLILDSGAIATVNTNGVVTSVDTMRQRGAVFTGRDCEVVSFIAEEQVLVLPDGSKKDLAFEPAAVAAYYDGELVTVCVLSEDCQHYQFLTF